jgi:amidase
VEQIRDLGSQFGLVLTGDELSAFQQAFKGPLSSFDRLEQLVSPSLAPVIP